MPWKTSGELVLSSVFLIHQMFMAAFGNRPISSMEGDGGNVIRTRT